VRSTYLSQGHIASSSIHTIGTLSLLAHLVYTGEAALPQPGYHVEIIHLSQEAGSRTSRPGVLGNGSTEPLSIRDSAGT
jgi:hypothetical protein